MEFYKYDKIPAMQNLITWIIFSLAYSGVAVGHIPGLALDRTGFALLGAIAMVTCGTLSVSQAMNSIDASTILLLLGLMIVSSQLRLAGFHTEIARRLMCMTHRPKLFLFFLMTASGVMSAFLVNDIICLAFAPIAANALLRAKLNPVPYLVGLAAASNIGSAATLIGNPQNMYIGQIANLNFTQYAAYAFVPAVLSLLAAFAITLFFLVRENAHRVSDCGELQTTETPAPPVDRSRLKKGAVATALVILFFFFSPYPREIIALTAAGCLLCSRKLETKRVLAGVDTSLLLLFCALFILVAGFSATGAPAGALGWLSKNGIPVTSSAILIPSTAILSNAVSNLPAVMLLEPFLRDAGTQIWSVLALASTFAGNLITIGSIANLIVIQSAADEGINISFKDYIKIGIPTTIVSLIILYVWTIIA